MGAVSGAENVLLRTYATREWKTVTEITTFPISVTVTKIYRETQYREYKTPYDNPPPEAQVTSTPAGGWQFDGYDTQLDHVIPGRGTHIDRFSLPDTQWYDENGDPYP